MFSPIATTFQRVILTVAVLTLLIVAPGGTPDAANAVSESHELDQEHWNTPSTPINAALSIDSYPPVGQPATLTCEISSVLEAPGTTAQIELPANARLLSGDINWQGDLVAGESVEISAKILFEVEGDAAVFCRAIRVIDAENSWGDLAELYLSIGQEDSQAGFSAIPIYQRHELGEPVEAGNGQLLDEAKAQAVLPSRDETVEPPPVDPVLNSDDSPTTSTSTLPMGSLVVTGRWGYYDRDDNYSGALEFLVELIRGDNGDHLAWCYTDISGYYSCGPVTNPGSAGVRTAMFSYTSYNPNPDLLVVINPDWGTVGGVDNAFGTQTGISVFSDGTHDIGSWVSSNGSSYERAYWIQRDLNDTWRYIWFGTGSSQSPQETTGPSTVEWKIDSTHGTHYHHGGNIHLTGADPLSDTVVAHEYGHNIMYTVYGSWMPTTYCPSPHYINLSSHVNCAWTEGWANFLPLAVNNDPVYRWASGSSINLENPTWGSSSWDEGDDVEGHVAGALWDVLDTTNEGDDQYSDGGITNIWDTLYHQNDNNFSENWSAWKSRGHNNSSAGPVMSLYQSTIDYRNSPAGDDFDIPFVFSGDILMFGVVTNTVNATTQGNDPNTSCGSGIYPKQSRSMWIRFTPDTSGNYNINTEGSDYDTVLAVWTGSFGSLTDRDCDDDSGPGLLSSLTLALTGGTTYYIEAMQYGSGSGGLLDLNGQAVLPDPFSKSSPANGATGQPTNPTLSWGSSSGAASYEYCIDTTNNSSCDGSWTSVGNNNTVSLGGLSNGTTYYWQVRARSFAGTRDANEGTWWSFATQVALPGTFSKNNPSNGATGQPTNPTLSWGSSSGAASYEYCVDTTNNSSCDGSWTSVGSNTSVGLSGLSNGTTYYWQVRARNATGTRDANGGTWWSFTTQVALPGTFSKISPTNGATGQPTNPMLSWGSSSGAASYEFCVDTINNNVCDGSWTSVGNNNTVSLGGLSNGTTYYWQVRARNAAGTTEANNGTWWSFTIFAENIAPTLSGLEDQFFDQSYLPPSSIDLWAYTEDTETPDSGLTFTIASSPPTGAGITLIANRYLQIDPSNDWCGFADVTVRVTDPGGLWDEDTLRVGVTWSCRGPLPVPNQNAKRDQSIILDLSDYEPQIGDGTGMVWSVSGEDNCTVSGEGNEDDILTFTPQQGLVGSDVVALHMTYPWGGEATQALTLTWKGVETPALGFRLYLPVATSDH